jgi:hypothetical protein
MSKCENSILFSLSRPQIFREKPQRGTSGEPFIKRTTLDWFMSPRRRFSSSSGVSVFSTAGGGIGGLSEWESGVVETDGARWFVIAVVSAGASAPVMRPSKVWPWVVGTRWWDSQRGSGCVAYPKDDKGRNTLNLEGFGDFTLFFCFDLERQQLLVFSREFSNDLGHLLAGFCPWSPKVEEGNTVEILWKKFFNVIRWSNVVEVCRSIHSER